MTTPAQLRKAGHRCWHMLAVALLLLGCARQTDPDPTHHNDQPAPATPPAERTETPVTRLLGPRLVDRQGKTIHTHQLDAPLYALYFAAHWSPPSRFFTRRLMEFQHQLEQTGRSIQIILVSWDRSEADMLTFMDTFQMPWPAIPWLSSRRTLLAREYHIHEIPALLIFDAKGQPVGHEARAAVISRGIAVYDEWLLE